MSREKYLTTAESAERLGITRQWFHRLVNKHGVKPDLIEWKKKYYTVATLKKLCEHVWNTKWR